MSDTPVAAPAPPPPAPPPSGPRVQTLDALELAAFQASVTRMTRAGFELRSAEKAHDNICAAFLGRMGLDPAAWKVNPGHLERGLLVLMPVVTPEKKDDPAPAAPATDPPPAASLPSPTKPERMAAGMEMTWEDPKPVLPGV